jgi:hypothetical protein
MCGFPRYEGKSTHQLKIVSPLESDSKFKTGSQLKTSSKDRKLINLIMTVSNHRC